MATLLQSYIEVCIFRRSAGGPEYLILERSAGERVYPLLWQFVTGSLDPDEKGIEGARREVLEETGLTPSATWVVPFVNTFFNHRSDSIQLSPVFAMEVDPKSVPALSHEHDRYEWMTYQEASERLVWPGQKEGLRIVHEFIVSGSRAAEFSRIA